MAIGIVGTLAYLAFVSPGIEGLTGTTASGATAAASDMPTVEIQEADLAQSAVSASGNLALKEVRSAVMETGGIVAEVNVEVGDAVTAGQVLLTLDTTDLERAADQAELNVEAARLALDDVQTPATASELAEAEASLLEARENLDTLLAGTDSLDIAAASSSLSAAQASYDELLAGPSESELTQLSASLRKAEISLQEAQGNYDKVAWQGSASAQAAALQSATIDYESARAAFEQASEAASDSEIQTSLSNIQSAQAQLSELMDVASDAEVAAAQAKIDAAQATLDELRSGADASDVRSKEITLQQALIELEAAGRELDGASLIAPISGVIITVNAEEGARLSEGEIVATMANPTQLELEISVAESDIPAVTLGQAAEIEIDALPGRTFAGVVTRISPTSDSSAASVSYPVTIELGGSDMTDVMAGMNAVATLTRDEALPENSWLVPSNAIMQAGEASTVMVVRDGVPAPVEVSTGAVQGEWTIVQSDALTAGDNVVGSLTSQLGQQFGGGMMMIGGGPPAGGMPAGGPRP
jgi:multidrug efflux pump subunit AcrA (membrane-fusion protein)